MFLGLIYNTLVTYDKLSTSCPRKGSYKQLINPTKQAIRDYLRSIDEENAFTLLQGEVYGSSILRAKPSPGIIDALFQLKSVGIKTVLVSHKNASICWSKIRST